jgi:hypothetical protein
MRRTLTPTLSRKREREQFPIASEEIISRKRERETAPIASDETLSRSRERAG